MSRQPAVTRNEDCCEGAGRADPAALLRISFFVHTRHTSYLSTFHAAVETQKKSVGAHTEQFDDTFGVNARLLYKAMRQYLPNEQRMKVSKRVAQEMVFDALVEGSEGRVGIDRLFTILEMVPLEEIEDRRSFRKGNSGWRQPSGSHLQYSSSQWERVKRRLDSEGAATSIRTMVPLRRVSSFV